MLYLTAALKNQQGFLGPLAVQCWSWACDPRAPTPCMYVLLQTTCYLRSASPSQACINQERVHIKELLLEQPGTLQR